MKKVAVIYWSGTGNTCLLYTSGGRPALLQAGFLACHSRRSGFCARAPSNKNEAHRPRLFPQCPQQSVHRQPMPLFCGKAQGRASCKNKAESKAKGKAASLKRVLGLPAACPVFFGRGQLSLIHIFSPCFSYTCALDKRARPARWQAGLFLTKKECPFRCA